MNPNDIINNAISKLYGSDWVVNAFMTIYFSLGNDEFVRLMAALLFNNKHTRFNDVAIKSFMISKLQDHVL